MNVSDRQTPRDPDDWFDEPEQVDPDARTRERAAAPVADWLIPGTEKGRRASPSPRTIATRRLLLVGGIALALLLIGLAVGGVFSGGSAKRANKPVTSRTAPTTTTTQATTPTPAVPSATLKLGTQGPAVKQLQRALAALGYSSGRADGVFGTSTQRELIAFQTAHHLTPDGVLGPATRAALQKALRSQG